MYALSKNLKSTVYVCKIRLYSLVSLLSSSGMMVRGSILDSFANPFTNIQ